MNYDNVQLWFSKNEAGDIVTINEVNKESKEKYYCPLCGSEVIPRQGDINSWCFAHIDKSKCSSESMIHFWVKNKLIEPGDKFVIKTDVSHEYICKEVLIEKEYTIDDKLYRPDLTILTDCDKIIYFEMTHSNKKKIENYIDIWMGLGNIVVEVDTKDIISASNKSVLEFNALYYDGKCFNVKKGEDSVYHETIGILKEQLRKNKEYENRKNDIEELDWFWYEIHKFNQDKISLSDIILFIDSVKDKDLIYRILKKSKCNNIKELYEHHKINQYKRVINNLLGLDVESYGFKIVIGKNGVNKRIRLVDYTQYGCTEYFSNNAWGEYLYDKSDVHCVSNKIKEIQEYKDFQATLIKELETNRHILNIQISNLHDSIIYFEDMNQNKYVLYNKDFYWDESLLKSTYGDLLRFINLGYKNIKQLKKEGFRFVLYSNNIYEFEHKNDFSIVVDCKYKTKILDGKSINLTYFRDKEYARVPRFDFVQCTKRLHEVITSEINPLLAKKKEEFYKSIENEVFVKKYNTMEVQSNEIDEKLQKLIYPIYYISQSNDIVNVSLNCDFTKEFGSHQPWLIKDFIETLESLGVTNISNIK